MPHSVTPPDARDDYTLGEFDFMRSTYVTAAETATRDRKALER